MLITSSGMVNRTRASEVRVTGRNTQGVRIINLRDNDKVVMVAKVAREDQPEGPAEDLATATTPEAPMPPATPPPEANGQA
jgi:DNA gyrase subunit A